MRVAFSLLAALMGVSSPAVAEERTSSREECGLYRQVLQETFPDGRVAPPLQRSIGRLDAGDPEFAANLVPSAPALPEKARTELAQAIAAAHPSYRITCVWAGIDTPPMPAPSREWCDSPIPIPPLDAAKRPEYEAEKKRFDERSCPFPGGTSLGQPAYSRDRRWAVITIGIGYGWLGGKGSACLFHKTGMRWSLVECKPTWIS